MPPKAYPDPLSIDPLSTPQHTHTLILLHGRGSNASRFGHELLRSANLPERLPTVKFVFPTARRRRSTILKKIPIHQWYDNYSLDDPNERTDLQVEGLCETAAFLRELVAREAGILREKGYEDDAYSRIVLGGLSQGCAAGIFTLLGGGWGEDGKETLGAFCGMSGWLPFQGQLGEILNFKVSAENDCDSMNGLEDEMDHLDIEFSDGSSEDDAEDVDTDRHEEGEDDVESDGYGDDNEEDSSSSDDDPYEPYNNKEDQDSFDPFREDSEGTDGVKGSEEHPLSRSISAINHVRDILDLPALSTNVEKDSTTSSNTTLTCIAHIHIPVFLGHGAVDPKVSVRLGDQMAQLLSGPLAMDVTWKRYEDLGHWYKVPDEIDDLVDFLRLKIGVPLGT